MSTTFWKRLVAILILFNVLAFGTFEVQHAQETAASAQNATSISQIEANSAVLSAQQQQQALIFNTILAKFFAEQDWLCEAAVAHNATLGGPPAPAGICNVSFPTPKPSG